MRTRVLFGLVLALLSGCTSDTSAADSPEAAAMVFLELIDEGRYDETWSAASPWLQKQVDASGWAVHAGSSRQPLGNVNARSLQSVEYEDPPDMPHGEYAFVIFDTLLEGDARATELVGLMLDDDSRWRVIGYQTL